MRTKQNETLKIIQNNEIAFENYKGIIHSKQLNLFWDGLESTPVNCILEKMVNLFHKHTDAPLEIPYHVTLSYVAALAIEQNLKINIAGKLVSPTIWKVILAPSGSCKSIVAEYVDKVFKPSKIGKLDKFDSAAKFVEMLAETNPAFFVNDEFGQLVYDLTALSESRSPFKTCHNVAVALDEEPKSPLHRRIKRLGTATPGRKHEPITQAAFVESLVKFISIKPDEDRNKLLEGKKLDLANQKELSVTPFRNLFVEERDLDIAEILFNYFTAVRNKWPNSWEAVAQTGNLLPRSNAFKALMKYLLDVAYKRVSLESDTEIPSIKDFEKCISHIDLSDADFTSKNFVPGSGGQSTFYKILTGELTRQQLLEEE